MPVGRMYYVPAKGKAVPMTTTARKGRIVTTRSRRRNRYQKASERTTKFISKVLSSGVKYLKASYSTNVTLNHTIPGFYDDDIVSDIPRYNPAGTSRETNLEYARTDNTAYFKSIKIDFCMTNYADRAVGVRMILFKNDAWNEALNTATGFPNLFVDVNGNDAGSTTLINTMFNRPFNFNLVRNKRNLLMDKTVLLPRRTSQIYNGSGTASALVTVSPTNIKRFTHYIKVNRKVEWETDSIGEQLKNGRYYLILLYANDDDTANGNVVVDYFATCVLAQA